MIYVVAGVAIAVLLVFVVVARGRRAPDGVASFQRQIDALSPEARRPVVKRLEDVTNREDPEVDPPDAGPDTGRGGLDGA